MTREEIGCASDPAALRSGAAGDVGRPCHGPSETSDTVSMTGDYRGHRIVIDVRYRIVIDDTPLATPLTLDGDGVLGSHALPQYAFRSPMDLVKSLIDSFGEYW